MAIGDFGRVLLVRRCGYNVGNRDVLFIRVQGDVAPVDVGISDAGLLDGLLRQVDTAFGCYDRGRMDEDTVRDGGRRAGGAHGDDFSSCYNNGGISFDSFGRDRQVMVGISGVAASCMFGGHFRLHCYLRHFRWDVQRGIYRFNPGGSADSGFGDSWNSCV